MQKSEIFINPTVKAVIFQIRFPNLFYIESKIGEYQLEIMEMFPQSNLLIQKPIFFTNIGQNNIAEDKISEDKEGIKKIWQFSSPKGFKLNILNESIDITSEFHKTYDNPKSQDKFRDIIDLVVSRFFKIMRIPVITRIGLRYINECPLPQKETVLFKSYFNPSFNLTRFPLEDLLGLEFLSVYKKGDYTIRHTESLKTSDTDTSLSLIHI